MPFFRESRRWRGVGASTAVVMLAWPVCGDVFEFATPTEYPVGYAPSAAVSGDFDGDGIVDVAVTNRVGRSVTVLRNDGAGNFATHSVTDVGVEPRVPAAAYLNADAHLDVIVPHWGANETTIGVLINNGDGTFAPMVEYTVGSRPRTVTAAFLNDDEHPDVAVANFGSDSISVLLNDGTGGLLPPVDYAVGLGPGSVSAGDLDGDDDVDLVTTNRESSTVTVHLNQAGTGTFVAGGAWFVGLGPRHEALDDFDNDGDLDIVTANGTSNSLSVLLNDGSANFVPGETLSVGGGNPHGVTTADFDGDGDVDIACADIGLAVVHLFRNRGMDSGVFAEREVFEAGEGAAFVVDSDFNADQRADLAIPNMGVSQTTVLLNLTDPPACLADPIDCNGNGFIDACEVADGWSDDCNGNFVPDACEIADGSLPDCDENGVADGCQPDCDGNGIPNVCDIAADPSLDLDENGVPDSCEMVGDFDGDGLVAIPDFILVILNWGPCPDGCSGDANGDGTVNVLDLLIVLLNWGMVA